MGIISYTDIVAFKIILFFSSTMKSCHRNDCEMVREINMDIFHLSTLFPNHSPIFGTGGGKHAKRTAILRNHQAHTLYCISSHNKNFELKFKIDS